MGTANKQNYIHLDKEEKMVILKKHLYWKAHEDVTIIANELEHFTLSAMQDLKNALTEIIKETKKRKCS